MSRVAKNPVNIVSGIDVNIADQSITVSGSKGSLSLILNDLVSAKLEDGAVIVSPKVPTKPSWAQAGTARALINNMVVGVSVGFERRLQLIGVGYRAQSKGSTLNISVGYSHPIVFEVPKLVTAETPSQTEIVLRSADRQLLGQVAANIRSFRPPEPYKGKGIRFSDEVVKRKEAKKK